MLCDASGDFPRAKAESLLMSAFNRGMVSVQVRNGWPQNLWAVTDGIAYEAQLENNEVGSYHGYPLSFDDDFRQIVLAEWMQRG